MKSLKIRLELNNKQKTLALKHAGVARHAYNWGLDVCNKAFENKEKRPTGIDLHKKLVAEVKSKYDWYYEVSKCAPQQALRDLDTGFQRFFKKVSKYPKFKKKGRKDSFYLEGNIEVKKNRIKLPHFGWIKLSEKIKDVKNIKNVSISRQADFWFVSFKMEHQTQKIRFKKHSFVGVDLGIKTLATLSNGMTFENRRPYKIYKRKLKIEQRKLSKKFQKGKKEQSKNYYKQQKIVAKLHYKIACIREDALHKLTSYLSKNHEKIAIEDLNVKGMSKNHKLSSAILDGGFYEFRRQLTYKCEWYGSKLVVVNRFFASSKICSNCGHKKENLTLKDRVYHCEKCGLRIDRDLNASVNLAKQVVS
ncbi:MAG: transposase [Cytophagia bacterium]|nr:MAG: transposase [Cytophagia bacterium]TAG41613.1 MAG: transposase [Cytophagia bacterium]